MFDKDLFYSLCEKYDIELSDSIDEPMLKDGDVMRPIVGADIKCVFAPYQIYFDYMIPVITQMRPDVVFTEYDTEGSLAVAC